MEITERITARIDLDAVSHNLECMRRTVRNGAKFCAVVKADAYGHGAVAVASHIEGEADLWGFAVASLNEALDLRKEGIKKPILILGYVFPQDYELMIREEIRPAMYSAEMLNLLDEAVKRSGRDKPYPVHLAVDTGMSRIGFADTLEDAKSAASALRGSSLFAEGLFSHFARADEVDKTYAGIALERYLKFAGYLEGEGVHPSIRHISNSAAILEFPEAHLDMVRAGITLYGIYPSDEMKRDKDLRPVMSITSRVIHVKEVEEGTSVSYGGTFTAGRRTRIATICTGYADGYPRLLSGKADVIIRGKRCPVLGRVCMDQLMADVTEVPGVCQGDVVTLMGRDGDEIITVDELGEKSGRFPYEFVCDIGKRVKRLTVDGSCQKC